MRIWRVLGVLALFFLAVPAAGAAPDLAVVRSYEATYDVSADGSARVVETMRVNFPAPRHGITRDFDGTDPNWTPRDLEVTQDGKPAEVVTTRDDGLLRVRVGNPDVTSTGVRVYRFSYRYDNVLEDLGNSGDRSVMHWYAVAPRWQMKMNHVRVQVTLPGRAGDVECTVGSQRCEVAKKGKSLTLSADRLAPQTPMLVRAVSVATAPAADPTPTATPSATPTPTESPAASPSAAATPTPTPTVEPSSSAVADPEQAAEESDDSSISGTAVVVTLLLVLLVASGLVWLMSRRNREEETPAETLSILEDEAAAQAPEELTEEIAGETEPVDGEVDGEVDGVIEGELVEEHADASVESVVEEPEVLDGEILSDTADPPTPAGKP